VFDLLIFLQAIAPDDARAHVCAVRFLHATQGNTELPAAVAAVVARQAEELGLAAHASLAALNQVRIKCALCQSDSTSSFLCSKQRKG